MKFKHRHSHRRMGNQQSTGNRRLSKPKTNTNSPSLLLVSDLSVSSRYASTDANGERQLAETMLSPVRRQAAQKGMLNEENNVQEYIAQARGRSGSVISLSRSQSDSRLNSLSWFGKHGSITKHANIANSESSSTTSVQVNPEFAAHEWRERFEGHPNSSGQQSHVRKTAEVNSARSSLTRRRSLVQDPGVATRHPRAAPEPKSWNSWKTPVLDPAEQAKWDATPKRPSYSSRPRAVTLTEKIRECTPRAQTPGELDYSALGGLRLGSLRVVNGAASPAPSARTPRNRVPNTENDDYFSKKEGDPSPLIMKTARKHTNTQSLTPQQSRNRTYSLDRSNVMQPGRQLTNVLQREHQSSSTLTQDRDALALNYGVKLRRSPYEDQTPSEDNIRQLALDQISRPESTNESNDIASSPLQERVWTVNSVAFVVMPRVKAPVQKQSARLSRPMLSASDSGYSSSGSLPVVPVKESQCAQIVHRAHRSDSLMHDTNKPDDVIIDFQYTDQAASESSGASMSKLSSVSSRSSHRPPSLKIIDQSASQSTSSSTSGSAPSSITPHSIVSMTSSESVNSVSLAKKGPTNRTRSSQVESLVIQFCQPISEGTIPQVPDDVRSCFSRRLSTIPGTECLTRTYCSKDHVVAKKPIVGLQDSPTIGYPHFLGLGPDQLTPSPTTSRKKAPSFLLRETGSGHANAKSEVEDEKLTSIDSGDIASTFGRPSYDFPVSHHFRSPSAPPSSRPQLGNSLPRAKSTVAMDDKATAELGRIRSRDRAYSERDADPHKDSQSSRAIFRSASTYSRTPSGHRLHRSLHNLKMEVGEGSHLRRPSRSHFDDAPPVPPIDTLKLLMPHTALPGIETKIFAQASRPAHTEAS